MVGIGACLQEADLARLFPDRLERAVPIQALVFPRVTGAPEAKVHPASRAEALLALGPSSLFQIPNNGLGVRDFNTLAQLVERVPCYRLEVGSDLESIADCVEELLTEVGHDTGFQTGMCNIPRFSS